MSRATAFRWAKAEKDLHESGGTDAKGRKSIDNQRDASFMKLMADFEASKSMHKETKTEPES
jgi:hypothetical protein